MTGAAAVVKDKQDGQAKRRTHPIPAPCCANAAKDGSVESSRRRVNTMSPIRFRPHHFLCSVGFAGRGYSKRFASNMRQIVDGRLRSVGGDQVALQVVATADAICAPCPHRRGEGCTRQRRIDGLDQRHAQALELRAGDVLTWGEARRRIATLVKPNDLDRLCAGCQWLPLGLCKKAVAQLREELPSPVAPNRFLRRKE